jgi:hypothetical protein
MLDNPVAFVFTLIFFVFVNILWLATAGVNYASFDEDLKQLTDANGREVESGQWQFTQAMLGLSIVFFLLFIGGGILVGVKRNVVKSVVKIS